MVGERRHRAPPERDVLVDQDVGSSGGREKSPETANISVRRLKRSVNNMTCTFPRGVSGSGPK